MSNTSKTDPPEAKPTIVEQPRPVLASLPAESVLRRQDTASGFTTFWTEKGWVPPTYEPRDMIGYGNPKRLPKFLWPGDRRVAVSFVLNFEEGSEPSVGDGDLYNECISELTFFDNLRDTRDFCIESHFEYGTRVGYWRIMEAFSKYGIRLTLSACGRAVERSPWVVKDAASRGHEIAAHGYRWESHERMSEAEEAESIDRCIDAISRTCGTAPVGWHTRSRRSPHTRGLLVKRGFLYSDDAYNDETPYFVEIDGKLHLILPYAFDTNDMQFQNTSRFTTATSFSDYVCDAFDWLSSHETYIPRMITIGLHLRVISRPGRMPALEKILEHITASNNAWITTREDIARHWIHITSSRDISLPSPSTSRASSEALPKKSSGGLSDSVISRSEDVKPIILVINPNTSHAATELITGCMKSQEILKKFKVVGITATIGSTTICTEESYAIATYSVIDAYKRYRNGMVGDNNKNGNGKKKPPCAIIVGCFGDPGIWALREVVSKEKEPPIVMGLAEGSILFALSKFPGRFGIVTGGAPWGPILTRFVSTLQLDQFFFGVKTINLNGAQLAADRANGLELLKKSCIELVGPHILNSENDDHSCSCVILGGGLLAGMAKEIQFHLPLIDCVAATACTVAEAVNKNGASER